VGFPFPDGTELPEPEEDVTAFLIPEDPEGLALEKRPEMKSLNFYRKAALRTAEAAAGQARPQVAFQGQARDVGDGFYPDAQDEWTPTLSATWTLYDHGEIKAQVNQAKARAREFLAQMSDLENQVIQEVATARLNLDSSLQRLDVARTQVDLAEEDYRMALQRYRVQVGTNLDVLDARVALIDARTQLVAAVYDAYTAQADFTYALGGSEPEPVPVDG
jgi:outer membrane protein TolC